MRQYILTKQERKMIRTYLNNEKKLDGFRVLSLRIRRYHRILKEDMALIEELITKMEIQRLYKL